MEIINHNTHLTHLLEDWASIRKDVLKWNADTRAKLPAGSAVGPKPKTLTHRLAVWRKYAKVACGFDIASRPSDGVLLSIIKDKLSQ